jgi:hypothetical protein
MYNSMTLPYKTSIDLPFGKLRSVVEWCTTNCMKNWAFDISDDHYAGEKQIPSYDFRFESEKDYITFLVYQK